jgi:hypothetical protein
VNNVRPVYYPKKSPPKQGPETGKGIQGNDIYLVFNPGTVHVVKVGFDRQSMMVSITE